MKIHMETKHPEQITEQPNSLQHNENQNEVVSTWQSKKKGITITVSGIKQKDDQKWKCALCGKIFSKMRIFGRKMKYYCFINIMYMKSYSE